MRYVYAVIGFVLVAAVLAACAGLDLGDLVRVQTPHEIQQTMGLPETTTLNDASAQYRAWLDDVQRVGVQWRSSIEQADAVRGILGQLTLQVANSLGPMLAGVPVLGPALPLITGIVGLAVGKRSLRKEKEASFNAGLEKGKES